MAPLLTNNRLTGRNLPPLAVSVFNNISTKSWTTGNTFTLASTLSLCAITTFSSRDVCQFTGRTGQSCTAGRPHGARCGQNSQCCLLPSVRWDYCRSLVRHVRYNAVYRIPHLRPHVGRVVKCRADQRSRRLDFSGAWRSHSGLHTRLDLYITVLFRVGVVNVSSGVANARTIELMCISSRSR